MNIALVAESQYDYLRIYLMLACEMSRGFRLHWIDQPTNVVDALSSEPFDLVLLYARTYGVSALDTLHEIRAFSATIPVVIISKARQANLQKPNQAECLGAVVLQRQDLTADVLVNVKLGLRLATAQ